MTAGIMDFVQRFNVLQLQRDSSDELIKVGTYQPNRFCAPFTARSSLPTVANSYGLTVHADVVAYLGPPYLFREG